MGEVAFPKYIEEFIDETQRYLESFDAKLHLLMFENQSRVYRLSRDDGPVDLIIHQTDSSLDHAIGEFRCRVCAELNPEITEFSRGKEQFVNHYATLGALITDGGRAYVSSQCLIRPAMTTTLAGVIAAAIVHARPSILSSIRRELNREPAPTVESLSAWGDLDFEQIQYDYAHLGAGNHKKRGWTMKLLPHGSLSLDAVHNNPYWGGGLLCLSRLPESALRVEDCPVDVNAMNKWENLIAETPAFGGWCRDGDDIVFAQFFPNLMKGLPHFTDLLIFWALRRLASAKKLIEGVHNFEKRSEIDRHKTAGGKKVRKPMFRKITLSCEGGGFPGGGWNATTELRPFDGGFAVWAVDADERFREISRWPRPLSWREAANALRATSQYGLQAIETEDGDEFFQVISVDGKVVAWQADMLRLAWVNYENADDDVLEHLLKLDDNQIRELWSALGSFVESAALRKLRQFVKLQKHYGLVGAGLIEHVVKERGLQKAPSYEEFLTMIAGYLNTDDGARETALEPFAVHITETTNKFCKTLDSPRDRSTGTVYYDKTNAFQEYLEDYVLIFGKIPQGEHDIPGVGKIDLEHLMRIDLNRSAKAEGVDPGGGSTGKIRYSVAFNIMADGRYYGMLFGYATPAGLRWTHTIATATNYNGPLLESSAAALADFWDAKHRLPPDLHRAIFGGLSDDC